MLFSQPRLCASMQALALLAISGTALPETRQVGDLEAWQRGQAGALLADEASEQKGCERHGVGLLQTTMLRKQPVANLNVEATQTKVSTEPVVTEVEDLWNSDAEAANATNNTLEKAKNATAKAASALKNLVNKSTLNESDEQNESNMSNASQAVVHVTIDIAELPEDNRSVIAAGVETARSLTNYQIQASQKHISSSIKEQASLVNFQCRESAMIAKNLSKGILDGVITKITGVNCSVAYLVSTYRNITGVNIIKVLQNTTNVFQDGTCGMTVSRKEADRQMQEALEAQFDAVCAITERNASSISEQATKAMEANSTRIEKQAFVGSNSTFYRSAAESKEANKTLKEAMSQAVLDTNSSVAEKLEQVEVSSDKGISTSMSEALDASNASLFLLLNESQEFTIAIENATKLGPIADLKIQMHIADLKLARAHNLVSELEEASKATRTAQLEAAVAKQKELEAASATEFFVNLSINKSHAAAEELSNMSLGLVQAISGEGSALDSSGGPYISEKEQVTELMAEAQNASEVAGLKSAERAKQRMLYEASLRKSVFNAKEEAVIADALTQDLDRLMNVTAIGMQDTADEMNATFGIFESLNTSIPEYFGQDMDKYFGKDASALLELSIGERRVKSTLLTKASDTRSQDLSTTREPKPGNVTVHVAIDGGNDDVVNAIVSETERSLKELFGDEVDVKSYWSGNDTGGDYAVQATVPDVDAGTVEQVTNTTAQAIQNVLGDITMSEAEVAIETVDNSSGEIMSSEAVGASGNQSTDQVVAEAAAAGERIFGAAQKTASESTGEKGVPFSVAFYGLIVLVGLGLLFVVCMIWQGRS